MTGLLLLYNNGELQPVAWPVLRIDQFGDACCEMSLLPFCVCVCVYLNIILCNDFGFPSNFLSFPFSFFFWGGGRGRLAE